MYIPGLAAAHFLFARVPCARGRIPRLFNTHIPICTYINIVICPFVVFLILNKGYKNLREKESYPPNRTLTVTVLSPPPFLSLQFN